MHATMAKMSLCISEKIFQMNAKCKHRSGPAMREAENYDYEINRKKCLNANAE